MFRFKFNTEPEPELDLSSVQFRFIGTLHNVQCPTPSGPMDWTELDIGGSMSMSNVQPNTNYCHIVFINYFSEMNNQETEFDSSSFNNFLKEIEDDYKNCGSQIQTAFDKFAECYIAAKSQSIR
ncbi:hypothetical protein C2G38_2215946 [Gigaspora rosea]|uniref:Uncharacterized protein n=1 Tax=Gigaspora rosea TaxID=44941 RepID=A0A397UIB2_9GLOM|nr:hypothetical protein C2G38_2215946 [Gigaspora rosea]